VGGVVDPAAILDFGPNQSKMRNPKSKMAIGLNASTPASGAHYRQYRRDGKVGLS
jgi:hypothetical protein